MRRERSDSIASDVRRQEQSARVIETPAGLTNREAAEFSRIVEARTNWSDHDLTVAAVLARHLVALADNQEALRTEGYVVESDKGPRPNPRVSIITGLTAQVVACRRTIGTHILTGTDRGKLAPSLGGSGGQVSTRAADQPDLAEACDEDGQPIWSLSEDRKFLFRGEPAQKPPPLGTWVFCGEDGWMRQENDHG